MRQKGKLVPQGHESPGAAVHLPDPPSPRPTPVRSPPCGRSGRSSFWAPCGPTDYSSDRVGASWHRWDGSAPSAPGSLPPGPRHPALSQNLWSHCSHPMPPLPPPSPLPTAFCKPAHPAIVMPAGTPSCLPSKAKSAPAPHRWAFKNTSDFYWTLSANIVTRRIPCSRVLT